MFFEKFVFKITCFGKICEYLGTNNTSSNVSALFLIAGCSKPPAPKDAVFIQKDLPSWYSNPKQNDSVYIKFLGEDNYGW